MKTYPKYLIKLDLADTSAFFCALENALCNGWTRRPDSPCDLFDRYFIFQRDKPGHPPLRLVIVRDDAETLSIVNIVPREGGLTIAQYKAVLLDFQTSVLEKVLHAGFSITLLLGSDEIRIERLLHPVAFAQLQRFAVLANRNTGSLHLSDRDYWIAFLIAYHRGRLHGLTPDILAGWLREQHFSSSAISNLRHEFDFGLAALQFYDGYLAHLAHKRSTHPSK
jgi:hypothetical protein